MKLTYFNSRGLAENVRLVLAQAGVDYEDNRIDKETWAAMAETTPFGQVPVLEHDGKIICQSISIARYVANEHDLGGKDNWTKAQADMVVDSIMDLFYREIFPGFRAEDEEKKKEILKKVGEEAAPKILTSLTKLLENRGGEHFAGNELTWADIVVANMMDMMCAMVGIDLAKDFPILDEFKNKIYELPNIKNWIETRPKTDF